MRKTNAPLLAVILFCVASLAHAQTTRRTIPAPLPNHPGNIFLSTEAVSIALPEKTGPDWQLFDYEHREILHGSSTDGRIMLGKLPVGYYELKAANFGRITLGVVAPLAAPTPDDSPISIDVAMSWSYKTEARQRAAANLCRLAGMNWVRDRASWPEIEPKPGELAEHTTYDDTARIQTEAALKVLQVNHIPPPWEKDRKRFPQDLRDVHRFYREIAARWKGQVLAIEPWNEADIEMFGGEMGSEIATLQKAAYLGLKAGNADVIACQNVFAIARKSTLTDFAANDAPFDTYNLHHYVWFDQYPAFYAAHHAVSAGKAMWVTECNTPVKWAGDPKLKEPTDEDLRTQANCVAKIYAMSLHEGSKNTFFFMLPNYTEGQTQFGILHEDLTPRPAYLAVAAVGRVLAGAKPLGRWKCDDTKVHGYLFQTRMDGKDSFPLVIWRDEGEGTLRLQTPVEKVIDALGREGTGSWVGDVKLTTAPVFAMLSVQPEPARLEAPATQPALHDIAALNVVIQVLRPSSGISSNRSAVVLLPQQQHELKLCIYNFGKTAARGKLTTTGSLPSNLSKSENLEITPGDRLELSLSIPPRAPNPEQLQHLKIEGDFGQAGKPILSINVVDADKKKK
jgi:hypothetical protein